MRWIRFIGLILLLRLTPVAQADECPALNHEELVLLFLNGSDWTVTQLDLDAGLYMGAASNIYLFRAGMDYKLGTWDDRFFKSLQDLDDVPLVGEANIGRLIYYVVHNYVPVC